MKKREDDEPHPWAGPHRPQEHTSVGLGVVEGSRVRAGARNGDTPPSGTYVGENGNGPKTPRDPVTAQLAQGDASLILSQINRSVAKHEHDNEIIAGQIDALIIDSRADRAKLDGLRREVRALRAYAVRTHDQGAQKSDTKAIKAELDDMRAMLIRIEAALGRAPTKLEARASQQEEMTAAQMVELEQGTGALGVVGRLVAGQARLMRRVGLVAIVATTIPQIALVLLTEGHVAIVVGAIAALVAMAALFLAFRAVRARLRRSK